MSRPSGGGGLADAGVSKSAGAEKRGRTLIAIGGVAVLVAVAAVVAVVFVNSGSPRPPGNSPADAAEDSAPGPTAPDFETKILGGRSLSLAAARGKEAVVLGFFLEDCASCVAGMRTFGAVANSVAGQPVRVVALNTNPLSGGEALAAFAGRIGAGGFEIARADGDRVQDLARGLGVTSIDTTVIIDRQGKVLAKGPQMSKEEQLAAVAQSISST